MTQLYTKIKLYLEANGKTKDEFKTPFSNGTIELRNEGTLPSDAYIQKWEVSGLAQPTVNQLNAFDSEADTFESNEAVRRTRKAAYGDIGDQLDEIFKDIDAWKVRIQAIKDANAKE